MTRVTLLAVCLLLTTTAQAAAKHPDDKHYNEVGFFDIHVCNWPDRPMFLMPLLSTTQYDDIESVTVLAPDGKPLTDLNLSRFRVVKPKEGPEKHVFINQLDLPDRIDEGWYSARITLMNGEVFSASDYVVPERLARARGQWPANEQTLTAIPEKLTWEAVPGAGYYQVFIRDQWEDNELIYSSDILDAPELVLPPGLISDGGYYAWKIHARDINEDKKLGDFNSGSLSKPITFYVEAGE